MADTNGYSPLDEVSDDLSPLTAVHRRGLIAISVLAFLSFVSSTTLLLYLTFRFVRWHLETRRQRQVREDADGPSSSTVDLSLGLAPQHFMGDEPKPQEPAARKKAHPNQFLVLIYNLLLADIHQAASFMLNSVWVGRDGLYVRTSTCWAQAWLVQIGDVAVSFFITAIAFHTYLAVVWNYTMPQWVVYAIVVFLWAFTYLLAVLGIAITNNGREAGGFFVRATAWCWINVRYERLRLFLHYLWIFIAIALTGILYTLIFLSLRRRSNGTRDGLRSATATDSRTIIHNSDEVFSSSRITKSPSHAVSPVDVITTATTTSTDSPSAAQSHPAPPGSHEVHEGGHGSGERRAAAGGGRVEGGGGHHKAFLLYPLVYIVCTAPLALGRIATMAGLAVPLAYFCTAGALITSNGWLDVLLWGVTRHRLLFGAPDAVGAPDSGLETFAFMRTPHGRRWGNMVWVEGGGRGSARGPSAQGLARKVFFHDGGREAAGGRNGEVVLVVEEEREEGSRVARWFRRRMGWRPLGLGGGGAGAGTGAGTGARGFAGGGGGTGARRRGGSQGQAEWGPRGREDGMAIQMDMVTTVIVEPATDADAPPWDRRGRAGHAASGSGGSGNRGYHTDSGPEDGLGKEVIGGALDR